MTYFVSKQTRKCFETSMFNVGQVCFISTLPGAIYTCPAKDALEMTFLHALYKYHLTVFLLRLYLLYKQYRIYYVLKLIPAMYSRHNPSDLIGSKAGQSDPRLHERGSDWQSILSSFSKKKFIISIFELGR